MEELPQLPFDLILSYLSFVQLVKSRAVSRRWYNHINNFKVKTLLLFDRSGWLPYRKNILRNATQSYAISAQLEMFFTTFGPTILSNLRQLRLFYPGPSRMSLPVLIQSLQMLDKLEELAITGYSVRNLISEPDKQQKAFMYDRLELILPMLKRIRLESLVEIEKLNLVAPKLRNIELFDCFLKLNFVHRESIEKLLICHLECVIMKQLKRMKQLKYLHIGRKMGGSIDPFLSCLEQLREIHLFHIPYDQQRSTILQLFDQKQRYGCVDLKIYLRGLLLNGPDDPAVGDDHTRFNERNLEYMVENHWRMANQMPFYKELDYVKVKHIAPELAIELSKRLTALEEIEVTRSVRVQSFLYFLGYFEKNGELPFLSFYRKQRQELFNRLPEQCVVWRLKIRKAPSDALLSLKVLKNLAFLHVNCPIELQTVQKVLEELPFLFQFKFKMGEKWIRIVMEPPDKFQVWINKARADDPNLTDMIRSILEKRQKVNRVKWSCL